MKLVKVSHKLHLDWAGASHSASWLLVPWAPSWGQGTPALPAGMKAWWKTVVALGWPWGKTWIYNPCAQLLKRECAGKMSGTFPSSEPYSEVNKLYNSPLCSQSLIFWMYELYAVTIFGRKFEEVFTCFLCHWAEWVHKCQQTMELGAVASPWGSAGLSSALCLFTKA